MAMKSEEISIFLKILFIIEIVLVGAIILYSVYWLLVGKKRLGSDGRPQKAPTSQVEKSAP